MATSFLNKDLCHPTGEFDPFSLRVFEQFWTTRAGNLVQARFLCND